jgi:hypothetical protein
MKKFPLLTLFIALAVLCSAWSPAYASSGQAETIGATADTATLKITNPLPKAAVVTLRGANDYTFTVPANQTVTKTIAKGSYRYKYNGCLDKKYAGILPYKDGVYMLDITPCKMITVRIINPFLDDYKSTMQGWINYDINVPARQIKSFSVIAGTYWLDYTCAGDQGWEGKVRLKKNITWVMCTT